MRNKKTENSLQKLTVSELLIQKEIQEIDYEKLNDSEKDELFKIFNEKLNTKGVQKDKVVKQMWNLIGENQKNSLWERNHESILLEIHKHLMDNGRMPLIRDLERLTDLSRQTIHKHLKEYRESELFKDYKEQYKMLHSKVLDVVYKISMTGDIKACKLYLEASGEMIKASTYIDKQQNNHTENNFNEPFDIKKLISFTKTKD